jgi:8-oxo-dGTP diphosphatase
VAAVIERGGRWLLGRRPAEKRHGGLWEFPGGKIDAGETPFDAARRELAEELGLDVQAVGDRLLSIQDDGSPFVIEFFVCAVAGSPQPLEHSELGWFSVTELRGMRLAPADKSFVEWLAARAED